MPADEFPATGSEDGSLSRLLQHLIDCAGGPGSAAARRQDFDEALAAVVDRIRAILKAEVGDGDFASEAANSMARSILSRVYRQALTPAEQLIVSHAITKAYTLRRRVGQALVGDVAAAPEAERRSEEAGEQYVRRVVEKMRGMLKNRIHGRVFDCLIADAFEGSDRPDAEVARAAGCSVRTVERVRAHCRKVWLPVVDESRREMERLFAGMEGAAA